MTTKLRGKGPRTFISYAFGNELAPKLADKLRAEGFQVDLVVDTSLLGEASLTEALVRRISASELVVPVLDGKANKSQWVHREINLAHEHKRVVIPVVLETQHLPESVLDIPYLNQDNLDTLIPAALSRYAILPLDSLKPFHLNIDSLAEYCASNKEVIRVIVDSENIAGRMLEEMPAAVAHATEKQPELRFIIQEQVRDPIETLSRLLDWLDLVVPQFRLGVEKALSNWGPRVFEKALPAWQRLARLVVGIPLLTVARTLHPKFSPAYWGSAAQGMTEALAQVRGLENPTCDYGKADWALCYEGSEAAHGWLRTELYASRTEYVRCLIPDEGDLKDQIQLGELPKAIIEPETWAGFALPQIFGDAVYYAEDSSNAKYINAIVSDVSKYSNVYLR